MVESLQEIQKKNGAVFAEGSAVPLSFGNDQEAVKAASEGVALCDRSHWGRIQFTGTDRQNFLHNQSTNDIKSLKPGEGCDTVFVTSTARTIDLAAIYVLDESVLTVTSPNRREYLMTWLDRYIFFGDKVTLRDITLETAMFSLIGAGSQALLQQLGLEVPNQTYAKHKQATLAEKSLRIVVGSGLATEGYTIITDAESAPMIWETLIHAGCVPMGDRVWEQLRIQQGRPMPDQELTDEYNAVEASIWQAISLSKGCYIGQETIARLDTYKGVKQQIWGIRLEAVVSPGTPIMVGDEKVGVLTSVTETEYGPFGLGYVRTKAGGSGLKVQIQGQQGELLEVPFLKRERESGQT